MLLPCRSLVAATVLALITATPRVEASVVTAASTFGGSGDDALTGVAIASDGAIVVSGISSSAALGGDRAHRLADGTGFVARLDRTGTKLEWLAWIGASAGELGLTAHDEPIVVVGHALVRLAADGSAIAGRTPDVGAPIDQLAIARDGRLGLVAGNVARVFSSDGSTEQLKIDPGKSHATGFAFDPKSGDVLVSGDFNAGYGTCGGPWRSPFLHRYGRDGKLVSKLYDLSGQTACDAGLAADTHFDRLMADEAGAVWIAGAADGGNSVYSWSQSDLKQANPALSGACFASACYGWKGAAKPGLIGRLKPDLTDVDRASWVIAHFNLRPAPCSCDVKPEDGSGARPNSAVLDFVATASTGDVVAAGSSAWHFPVTQDAWFPEAAYAAGPAVVAVFDRDLKTMKLATLLPGTGGLGAAAFRGGKLVVVGRAPDNSAWKAPAGQESAAQAAVPSLPANGALQASWGGGTSDGYVYVACMTDEAECGAPPAAGSGSGSGAGAGSGSGSGGGGAKTDEGGEGSAQAGCSCRTTRGHSGPAATSVLAALVLLTTRRRRRGRHSTTGL